MIRSWRHKGLEAFFFNGHKAGIRPDHASKLRRQLTRLDAAKSPQDMNVPGWKLHGLEGALAGHYAVKVNGNWRMTFTFDGTDDGTDAVLVDYQDYH